MAPDQSSENNAVVCCALRSATSRVDANAMKGYERTYAPGFHDLIFGILRDARIAPNVSQTAAEILTLISLVDSMFDGRCGRNGDTRAWLEIVC
jgi:hypothetical protein